MVSELHRCISLAHSAWEQQQLSLQTNNAVCAIIIRKVFDEKGLCSNWSRIVSPCMLMSRPAHSKRATPSLMCYLRTRGKAIKVQGRTNGRHHQVESLIIVSLVKGHFVQGPARRHGKSLRVVKQYQHGFIPPGKPRRRTAKSFKCRHRLEGLLGLLFGGGAPMRKPLID